MNKHTPGMFKAVMLHGEGRSIPAVMAEGPDQVAIIVDGTWDDARLFAAAPDLLAALEDIIWTTESQHGEDWETELPEFIDAARAAIAKARGQE